MTETELANHIGLFILTNLSYLLGGLLAFVFGCFALSWKISINLHQREVNLLHKEINHQNERFTQYKSIVEQRINLIKNEAEVLKNKFNPKPTIFYQEAIKPSSSINESDKNAKKDQMLFSRTALTEKEKDSNSIAHLLNTTDFINTVITKITKDI